MVCRYGWIYFFVCFSVKRIGGDMTKDEALKLALEALELARSTHDVMLLSDPPQKAWKYHNVDWKLLGAVNQLRQAIAEAEKQEPVAWMRQDGQRVTTASDRHNYPDYETRYSIPLYTTPPTQQSCSQRQPNQQELDASYASGYSIGFGEGHNAGKTQRQPLTHEQRFDLLTRFEPHKNKWEAPAILIDMVEAAHGIKE
jgi:hypothetical protein